MQTTQSDAIIEELRAVRDEHAAWFDYDVEAIFRDIRAMQNSSDREYALYPPPVSVPETAVQRPHRPFDPGKSGVSRVGDGGSPDKSYLDRVIAAQAISGGVRHYGI